MIHHHPVKKQTVHTGLQDTPLTLREIKYKTSLILLLDSQAGWPKQHNCQLNLHATGCIKLNLIKLSYSHIEHPVLKNCPLQT